MAGGGNTPLPGINRVNDLKVGLLCTLIQIIFKFIMHKLFVVASRVAKKVLLYFVG